MDRRPLFALFAADAISLNGNTLAAIAIPWLVLQLTGQATDTAIVAASGLLPILLAAFLGGFMVDRLGHWQSSLIADLVSALAVAAIPILLGLDQLTIGRLALLVFIGALLDTPGVAARNALVPRLASQAKLDLDRANGIRGSLENGADFLGPALAGLVIASLGTVNALWFNALSFIASAMLIGLFIPRIGLPIDHRLESGPSPDQTDGLTGNPFQMIRRNPTLLKLAIIGMIVNSTVTPVMALILPFYAKTVLNSAAAYGFAISAFGLGATLSAVAYSLFHQSLSRTYIYLGGLGLMGVVICLIPFCHSSLTLSCCLFMGGLSIGAGNPIESSVVQEQTPEAVRGSVFSLFTGLRFASGPVALLVTGLLLDHYPVTVVILIIGLALASASLLGCFLSYSVCLNRHLLWY